MVKLLSYLMLACLRPVLFIKDALGFTDLTVEQYEQIQMGMSREAIDSIIKEHKGEQLKIKVTPPVFDSAGKTIREGKTMETYSWQDIHKHKIKVDFENNKAIAKERTSL